MINHGHIRVNKKRVNISSYLVKDTDLIEVRDKSKKLAFIDGSIQSKEEMCQNIFSWMTRIKLQS